MRADGPQGLARLRRQPLFRQPRTRGFREGRLLRRRTRRSGGDRRLGRCIAAACRAAGPSTARAPASARITTSARLAAAISTSPPIALSGSPSRRGSRRPTPRSPPRPLPDWALDGLPPLQRRRAPRRPRRSAGRRPARSASRRGERHGAPPAGSILWVQEKLVALKIPLPAGFVCDGLNGPLTEIAVAAFQGQRALNVDGVAGPKTLAALHASS